MKNYFIEVSMKILQILVLILGLTVLANAQKAILSGNIYDANGSLIVGAKVKAVNEKSEKFEAMTNDEGIYTLSLPFNQYNSKGDFVIAKYEITVDKEGFKQNAIKDFKFIPSSKGKMNLDFALDVLAIVDTITIDSANKK